MDQVKIGKFIAECRKNKKLTQAKLAEKLNITDRAISKWETGNGMPDSSIMLELCEELGISVNELLSGEFLKNESYSIKAEENLIEMKKQKELVDKNMLALEWILGYTSSIKFIILIFVASFIEMQTYLRIILIAIGLAIFLVGIFSAIKIEQIAGYYECDKCHHKYIPSFNKV